MIGRRAA